MTALRQDTRRALFEHYHVRQASPVSASAYPSLFAWEDFFTYRFELIGDHLCVFAIDELGMFMPLPPLGEGLPLTVVDACFERMAAHNGPGGITRIDNVSLEQRNRLSGGRFEFYKKGCEYLYYRPEIAALKGNAYKSRRWEYNACLRQSRPVFSPYAIAHYEPCLAVYDRWRRARQAGGGDAIFLSMLEENRTVHARVLKHAGILGLVARVALIDGNVAGYTVGYPVNDRVFCVLFEVADPTVRGLPVFLFRQLCRDRAVVGYPFINAMDDLGSASLACAKMSFRPRLLVPLYTVTLKEEKEETA